MSDHLNLLLALLLGVMTYTCALTEITKTGCGTTKGCFSDPENCDSSNDCKFLVTYYKDGDTIVFEMSGKNKWVGIGFNDESNKMPGTDANLCVTDSGKVSIQHYDLTAKKLPAMTSPRPSQISLNESRSDGDKTLCKFVRKITGGGKLKSLDKSYYLVYGLGDVSGGKPGYHSSDRKTSSSPVNLESFDNVKAKEADHILVKAHGTLLTIAWMAFASIGILMARYMKLMWSDQRLCGLKVWFTVHRTLMGLAVVFSIIGVILIFVHRKGWSEGIGAHPYTGIITVILAIINPIMALFRPHPEEPKRFIFNWAHRTVGLSALCLAVVTLFLAVFFKHLNIKDEGLPVMIVFCVGIAVVVICEIVLHVTSHHSQPFSKTDTQGTSYNLQQMEQEQPVLQSKETKIRYFMLVFMGLVAIATTIALVVIINTMLHGH